MDTIYAVISSIMQSEVLTGLIHPESSAQVQYIDANQGVMGLNLAGGWVSFYLFLNQRLYKFLQSFKMRHNYGLPNFLYQFCIY